MRARTDPAARCRVPAARLLRQVGLHVPNGRGALVERVTLEGAEGTHADLAAAAHLGDVLAHVGSSKAAILAAVEGLQPEPPVGGGVERYLGEALRALLRWLATSSAEAAAQALEQQAAWVRQQQGQQGQGQQGQGRQPGGGGGGGVADAPQQQDWRAEEAAAAAAEGAAEGDTGPALPPATGFPGMRLLLFLGGPPNCGAGAVVARRARAAALDAAAEEARAREMARDLASLTLDPLYPELSSWSEGEVERRAAAARAAAAHAAAAADAAVAAAGDLSHAAPPGVPAAELTANLAAAGFYAEAGSAAAALGVSIDLFALAGPRWMGACRAGSPVLDGVLGGGPHAWPLLATATWLTRSKPCTRRAATHPHSTHTPGLELLEPLVGGSGGTCLLYTCLEAAALPQDVSGAGQCGQETAWATQPSPPRAGVCGSMARLPAARAATCACSQACNTRTCPPLAATAPTGVQGGGAAARLCLPGPPALLARAGSRGRARPAGARRVGAARRLPAAWPMHGWFRLMHGRCTTATGWAGLAAAARGTAVAAPGCALRTRPARRVPSRVAI